MITLILTAFVISGGLALDAQPVKKKEEIKVVYKKAIHYTDEMRLEEEITQQAHRVNKLIDAGPSILKRCPKAKCTKIEELEEV